jgi:hypothetical protein
LAIAIITNGLGSGTVLSRHKFGDQESVGTETYLLQQDLPYFGTLGFACQISQKAKAFAQQPLRKHPRQDSNLRHLV